MSATEAKLTNLQPASVPLWREALVGIDWLSLRASPVYYGVGVPHGHGEPVVVIPGFLGSDTYLLEMYHWLRRIGYTPYYSKIGRNAECPDVLLGRLMETIDKAYAEHQRPLHLIGHSLGGLLARSAASQRPEQVDLLISLASPFNEIRVHPMVLAAAGFIGDRIRSQRARDEKEDRACYTGACTCDFAQSLRDDFPKSVRRAAIYTETDGVVDWRSCVEDEPELNIKVTGTHSGLAFNPQVYKRVAKLLAEE